MIGRARGARRLLRLSLDHPTARLAAAAETGILASKGVIHPNKDRYGWRNVMQHRGAIGTIVVAAAMLYTQSATQAFDDALYPALTGQWIRAIAPGAIGLPPFDPSKPPGLGQQAPLRPEYQAKFESTFAERAASGLGDVVSTTCLAPGMPMMMQAYEPMQMTVLPETTYILIDHIHESHRRIFTDGRVWPKSVQPTFTGYSIGKWIDVDGDGRFDVLEAETRHFKGPRVFDSSGIPLHEDGETVINERIYLDKADRNLLHDDITVIDHALTRPWTVMKSYRRSLDPQADWPEYICNDEIPFIRIGNETYRVKDGYLVPTRSQQPPPDLRYFNQRKK
jgi:hypothetical protein